MVSVYWRPMAGCLSFPVLWPALKDRGQEALVLARFIRQEAKTRKPGGQATVSAVREELCGPAATVIVSTKRNGFK